MLSYIFNTLLPLGFVSDGSYTSETYDLDAELLVEGIKDLLSTFNLNAVLKLFGRNEASSYNMLADIQFLDYDGSASSYVHTIDFNKDTKADYGQSLSFTFKTGSVTAPDGQVGGPSAYSAIPTMQMQQ